MNQLRSFRTFAAGFVSGALALAALPALADKGAALPMKGLNMLVEVMNRIGTDYVDPVTDTKLIEQCIAGMAALDARSSYLTAQEFSEITSSARVASIGVEVRTDNHQAVIVAPIDGTPAARAGLWPGDVILAIDAEPVTGKRLTETVRMLRGDAGSKVTLTLYRPGTTAPFDKVLTREPIVLKSSAHAERLPGGAVYLRISTFGANTPAHVRDALKAATAGGELTGIVLDLRQNPGGVLASVVQVADLFIEQGTILDIEGREASNNRTFSATPGELQGGAPIVVLVDAGTASGSEIVADALRTHQRAKLIGRKTFGIGTIQTILPLQDDSAIKITTARWRTAGGQVIEGNGLTPDIAMDVPGKRLPLAKDPVVQRGLAELRAKAHGKT